MPDLLAQVEEIMDGRPLLNGQGLSVTAQLACEETGRADNLLPCAASTSAGWVPTAEQQAQLLGC